MYKRSRVNIILNLAQLLHWFSSDFTAALLVDNNKIFPLRGELNSLSCKVCEKNCFDGRLITWLQTVN